jgi:hypothetical protein
MRTALAVVVALLASACGRDGASSGSKSSEPDPEPVCAKLGAWVESQSGINHLGFAGARLNDGRVLVTGGLDYGADGPEATTYEFDPKPRCWTVGVPMSAPRQSHAMVVLADGRVLVLGGSRGEHGAVPLATSEIFDPVARTWSAGPSMSEPGSPTVVALRDGRLFVVPDYRADAPWAEVVDPTGATPPVRVPGSRPLYGGTVTVLADGRVLMVGGSDGEGPGAWHGKDATVRTKVDLFDPKTGTVTKAALLPRPRAKHTATLLADGRVLVAGGQTDAPSKPHATTELYDPAKDTWTEGPAMTMGRYRHEVVTLTKGTLLAYGGIRDADPFDDYTAVIEVFDPSAGAWKRSETRSKWRDGMLVFALPDARALVVGGNSELNQPVTELLPPQ